MDIKNVFPYRSVRVKEKYINIYQSIFRIVLKREDRFDHCCNGTVEQEMWRRFNVKTYLHYRFRESGKLCLNLFSRKWLARVLVETSFLVDYGIWMHCLENGLKNYNLIFLKVTYVSEFRRLESKLFHSIIVDGKKEFLKVMIGFKQWNIGAVPSSVRRVPSRSSIE